MEILNIKNLTFKYPSESRNALNNVSLSVEKGDFILLCGASGSGKSTLLRLLINSLAPFGEKTGEICFNKSPHIALVGQDAETQIVSDTVWHNLAFYLESMGEDSNSIRAKVAETAEFFDLSGIFHKETANLSGGEKQLLNLASVMVADPDILLLDEPTSQLDPIAARHFIEAVKRLHTETNLTIIISEHRTEELWGFADKVCLLEDGEVVSYASGNNTYSALKSDCIDLPFALKLYKELDVKKEYPISISGVRKFLTENFKNEIPELSDEIELNNKVALKACRIFFRYEKNTPDILKGLDFNCNFGEITTLLGGNGSGKTTFFKLIANLNKPYSGKIKNYGTKTAVLPQNVKSVFTKDVLREDLALISENFVDICKELNITSLLDKNPYDLSGGEAQRAALAKILLTKPDILCLDEPTKGIDSKGKRAIKEILLDLKKQGIAIVIVSHDVDFTAEISDKCAFLFDGQIVSNGTPKQIFSSNKFYTTYASLASRHHFKNTVTLNDIIELCKRNGCY
ncbi:MAG: ATP-binding cassette domain-containing protein [Clostridia bacterium]|nr:ATP-binding cassette domain-containing protein [Clostridia bacterium]